MSNNTSRLLIFAVLVAVLFVFLSVNNLIVFAQINNRSCPAMQRSYDRLRMIQCNYESIQKGQEEQLDVKKLADTKVAFPKKVEKRDVARMCSRGMGDINQCAWACGYIGNIYPGLDLRQNCFYAAKSLSFEIQKDYGYIRRSDSFLKAVDNRVNDLKDKIDKIVNNSYNCKIEEKGCLDEKLPLKQSGPLIIDVNSSYKGPDPDGVDELIRLYAKRQTLSCFTPNKSPNALKPVFVRLLDSFIPQFEDQVLSGQMDLNYVKNYIEALLILRLLELSPEITTA